MKSIYLLITLSYLDTNPLYYYIIMCYDIHDLIVKGVFLMAYKIVDTCISCGACEAECPVSCISAGDGLYLIDADSCIECGACASVCPVGAPVQD
jgi:ferredoxin